MINRIHAYFNPRAPCGARLLRPRPQIGRRPISIHAPLAGRDGYNGDLSALPTRFQSTRPLRGATKARYTLNADCKISIHAPLAGRDHGPASLPPSPATFQSTRPLRGATVVKSSETCKVTFQSTRPLRGATRGRQGHRRNREISIHAPLAGRDPAVRRIRPVPRNFNPRAPCGARPC